VGVLENLYGGTFKHFAAPFPSKTQRPQEIWHVTHHLLNNPQL
jgi:hypothetical protein